MLTDQRKGQDVGLAEEEFTPRAEETLYAVVDNPAFYRQDAELIYQALRGQLRTVSFGDYLKRFIYRKAEIPQAFGEVPLTEYQNIIVDSFQNRGVPAAFGQTTSRVRAVARNWLTQQSVSRDVVLLLGFGLTMTPEDVNELLVKGLQETRINFRDPREMLCWYCYRHHLGFYKYQDLMLAAGKRSGQAEEREFPPLAMPVFQNEEELLDYAACLMTSRGEAKTESEAGRQLRLLYGQAQEVTAAILNPDSEMCAAGRKNGGEKNARRREMVCGRRTGRPVLPEEITPADIEKVFQAAVPKDRHGNLLPMKKSTLSARFHGRRLSRQRLEELLSGSAPVTRYDLIAMNFYIFSQRRREGEPRLQYYRRFAEQTNLILNRCGMGPLYSANPFECFLQMCIMSEDPLGTYADVIERSYAEADA